MSRQVKRKKVETHISEYDFLTHEAPGLIPSGFRICDVAACNNLSVDELNNLLKESCMHDGRGMAPELYSAMAEDSLAGKIRGWLYESDEGVRWGAVFAKQSIVDERKVMIDLICVKQANESSHRPRNIFKSLLALVLALAVELDLGVDLEAAQIPGARYTEQNRRLLGLYEHFGFRPVRVDPEHQTDDTIYMSMDVGTARSKYLEIIGKSAECIGSECCIT